MAKKFLQIGYENKFGSLGQKPKGIPFRLVIKHGLQCSIEGNKLQAHQRDSFAGRVCKVAKNFLHMGYENKLGSLSLEPKGIPFRLPIKYGLQCTIEGNKTAGPSMGFLCLVQDEKWQRHFFR